MKFLDFIRKHKILIIISILIILIVISFLVIFFVNPEVFNYKTITYERSSVCNTKEIVSEKAREKKLHEILGTTKYSDKVFVVNNFNISRISFKSYKNKPAKVGEAIIYLDICLGDKTRELKGRYEFVKNYVVVYFEEQVFVFYYDKKNKVLIDYNNYVQNSQEKYKLI